MAIEAPFHRKRFDLGYDFHLVDSTVAGNATDAFVHVGTVIEVNKVRQVVDSLPQHGIVIFETNSNWLQERAFRADDSKIALPFRCPASAVTVAASSRRWNRRMPCPFHCVVAVSAIHF